MNKEKLTERLTVRITKQLKEDLSKINDVNGFVRNAIADKLTQRKKESASYNKLIKKIEDLDPQLIHQDIKNLISSTFHTANELSKQNEILKLILRRATLGSRFSSLILDKTQSEKVREYASNEVIELIHNEIKKIDM